MHNKLAGTKGFGRTIKIHNTPLPPRPHAHVSRARSFTTYRHSHKADRKKTKKKTNSNMDSLINTTFFPQSD